MGFEALKGLEGEELTPAMRQYLELKARYPDCILFFQMGDFYEMFFEDAVTASRVLDIALTTREKGKENPIPMCGVPVKAAASYISKLLDHGYKVAVCEQVEDPRQAKGLVKREVVRVVTPGMVVEEENLPEGNNYLASLYPQGGRYGFVLFDLSTGEFRGTLIMEEGLLLAELKRNAPREVLLPEGEEVLKGWLSKELERVLVEFLPEEDFSEIDDPLLPQIMPSELRRAASAVLRYVRSTQGGEPLHIRPCEIYELKDFLVIDETTQRNLELVQSQRGAPTLLSILDFTVTPMGRRKLRHWLLYPLLDLQAIKERQEAVGELKDHPLERSRLREGLKGLIDLERLYSRLALNRATPRDLGLLRDGLRRIPGIAGVLEGFSSPLLRMIRSYLQVPQELLGLLERALVDDPPQSISEGGVIREGYNLELDELRRLSRDAKRWIAELEERERQRTGITNLRVGYNQVFGYYIEVTRSNLHLVPKDYVRKQTLVGAERFVTTELKEYEERVLSAEEKIKGLERELFSELRERTLGFLRQLQLIAQGLAAIDVLQSLAEAASRNHYVRPEVHEGDEIVILEGRHPVVERSIPEPFVANDTRLDLRDNQVLIITGPNMAGKSTYIRQVALIVLMAHMGSFVPAKEAKVALTDRVFSRIGASDDLARGQSTFMVEMKETATILKEATWRSLVILDEIGRGTSTYDGISIAWAVVEHLHNVNRSKTLFATHYHELVELETLLPRVKNYHIAVKEYRGEVVFLRELKPGGMSKSYGIQVAKLAGLPETVLQRAREVLKELERRAQEKVVGKKDLQLSLFHQPRSKVLEELKSIDPNYLTPLEALKLLFRWKQLEG